MCIYFDIRIHLWYYVCVWLYLYLLVYIRETRLYLFVYISTFERSCAREFMYICLVLVLVSLSETTIRESRVSLGENRVRWLCIHTFESSCARELVYICLILVSFCESRVRESRVSISETRAQLVYICLRMDRDSVYVYLSRYIRSRVSASRVREVGIWKASQHVGAEVLTTWYPHVEKLCLHVEKLCLHVEKLCLRLDRDMLGVTYGVATISRLLQIIGLLCKRAL